MNREAIIADDDESRSNVVDTHHSSKKKECEALSLFMSNLILANSSPPTCKKKKKVEIVCDNAKTRASSHCKIIITKPQYHSSSSRRISIRRNQRWNCSISYGGDEHVTSSPSIRSISSNNNSMMNNNLPQRRHSIEDDGHDSSNSNISHNIKSPSKSESPSSLFNSVDFGRFLNSQFNLESQEDPVTTPSTTNSVASLFKSSDFTDLYQGEDWNLDSLSPVEDEEEVAPASPPPIFKSEQQEHLPKLVFQSLDWDNARVPSLNDEAIAQAVAMQHSFEESIIAPSTTTTVPKPVAFADAFKSQDWTIGSISNDVSITPSMMDRAPPPEPPKPSFKTTAKNIFSSRDWLATEFLGTHEEISISPAMFQLEDTATTTTTIAPTKTTSLPTIAPAAAAEKTNWESMFIGQLQPAAATVAAPPKAPTTTKKRKRKKRPKVVPEHKTYVEISQHDVLLGRGGKSNHHPGNKRYREEVENFRPLYAALTTDEEKTSMSQALVDVMEQMGGRFLEEDKVKDPTTNNKNKSLGWYVVPNIVARRKASQALREDSDPEKRKAKRARFLAKKKRKEAMGIF